MSPTPVTDAFPERVIVTGDFSQPPGSDAVIFNAGILRTFCSRGSCLPWFAAEWEEGEAEALDF